LLLRAHPRLAPQSSTPHFVLQEPHAKQVQELLASQEAVAKERTRLEAVQDELKARRAEVAAQVE